VTSPAGRLPGTGPALPEAVAQALLDGVLGWFAEHAPDPPLPTRRYVAGGDPRAVAWDTTAGQVTVTLSRILLGLSAANAPAPARVPRADPANHARVIRSASFEVQIVRCAPGLASAEQLHAHGIQVTRDGGNLIRAVLAVANDGQLTRRPAGEAGVTVEDLTTLGPSGGAAASAVTITVPLL
jgi:hypothetical protein